MNRATFRVIAFALAALVIAPTPGRAQESRPATAATVEQQFEALVNILSKRSLDPHSLSPADATKRQGELDALIKSLADRLHAESLDEQVIRALRRDAVTQRSRAWPRLSGRVLRVGAEREFKDLQSAQATVKRGDLILLDAGEYTMLSNPKSPPLHDVAIVGQGPSATLLKFGREGEMRNVDRMLIEGVRIDCGDSPVCHIRTGGGLCLRDCGLSNYNSGAGGSNAIYAQEGVIWLQGCLFNGREGRAAGPRSMGDALDLRVNATLVARQCQFVENDEIVRATVHVTFDACTMLNTIEEGFGVIPYAEGETWLRESNSVIVSGRVVPTGTVSNFAHATDDPDFVGHVLDPAKPIDADAAQMARALELQRRLPYWIGLVHHDDAGVRQLAAARLSALVDVEIKLPKESPKDGETLGDLGVLFAIEQEYARLMNWYDDNRDRLRWDEAAGRYRVEGPGQ